MLDPSPTLARFTRAYPPVTPRQPVGEDFHEALAGDLPASLHALYDELGLGKLGDGLIELVDPRSYSAPYAAFLGGDAAGRVPFLLSARGEPLAYKRLGGREAEISILHTYGPRLEVLAYDLDDFFDRVLLTDDGLRQVVNVPLFRQLRSRLRKTRPGECYGFDPGLLREAPPGTRADVEWFEVVDAREQLELLLRRAAEE